MFTGLIQAMGTVKRLEPITGDVRIWIDAPSAWLTRGVALGDSIAIEGVCLTVVAQQANTLAFDVSTETLRCTTLGGFEPERVVNLESSLRVGDALGGHFVAGHVDALGRVRSVTPQARGVVWSFGAPAELMPMLAAKGSVAVNGVSLTVNTVDDDGFAVMLIPHTVAHTSFQSIVVGDAVNLEVDLLARYVARQLVGTQRQ